MHKLYSLKKAKEILIATNNPGKFIELKEILPKNITPAYDGLSFTS